MIDSTGQNRELSAFGTRSILGMIVLLEISDPEQGCADGFENKLRQARTDERTSEETNMWVHFALHSSLADSVVVL